MSETAAGIDRAPRARNAARDGGNAARRPRNTGRNGWEDPRKRRNRARIGGGLPSDAVCLARRGAGAAGTVSRFLGCHICASYMRLASKPTKTGWRPTAISTWTPQRATSQKAMPQRAQTSNSKGGMTGTTAAQFAELDAHNPARCAWPAPRRSPACPPSAP